MLRTEQSATRAYHELLAELSLLEAAVGAWDHGAHHVLDRGEALKVSCHGKQCRHLRENERRPRREEGPAVAVVEGLQLAVPGVVRVRVTEHRHEYDQTTGQRQA